MKHNIGNRQKGIGGKTKVAKPLMIHKDIPISNMPPLFSISDIQSICKWKHYQRGFQGGLYYSNLQSLLREKGLSEEDIKLCLHP